MKRLFITLALTLVTGICFAQVSDDHMKFMGISMGESYSSFVEKLQAKGFELFVDEESDAEEDDDIAILFGEFAGYNSMVYLPKTDLITGITIVPVCTDDDWSELEEGYFEFKTNYTKKYGKPSEEEETFNQALNSQDNAAKILALQSGNCSYVCGFSTDKGNIAVGLDYIDEVGCVLLIVYMDKINSDIQNERYLDDL